MQGGMESGTRRRQPHFRFGGLEVTFSDRLLRIVSASSRQSAFPADMYRRISVAAWAATMIGGALGWTALLHFV